MTDRSSSPSVSADPEALAAFSSSALRLDEALASLVRHRLGPALAAWTCAAGAERSLSLDADVTAFATACAGLDRWVGRVAAAFIAADGGSELEGPGLVGLRAAPASSIDAAVGAGPAALDQLSNAEAVEEVRRLARQIEPSLAHLSNRQRKSLRAELFPLWQRVRALYPAAVMSVPGAPLAPRPQGVDDALDVLTLPDRSRRANAGAGFVDGFVAGRADERGYDNGWGELGRLAGHLGSGFFLAGNARDFVVDVGRGHFGDAAIDAAAAVPVAGDLLESGETVARGAGELKEADRGLRAAADLERAESLGGHSLLKHVGKDDAWLAQRLADEPQLRVASSFTTRETAQWAAGVAMTRRAGDIDAWLLGDGFQLPIEEMLGRRVGRALERGVSEPYDGETVRVLLRRSPDAPNGFYIHTMVVK